MQAPCLAVWFPTIRAHTGTDVFTERLAEGLEKRGIRTAISWLPLRSEYAPWTVRVPSPPAWATLAHVNTCMHTRFLPRRLPVVATLHHSVHDTALNGHKPLAQALYHRYWIAPNERRVLRSASCVTAVSQFVADTAQRTLLDVPIRVIHNGVDTGKFMPGTRQRHMGHPFRLLYIGSWIARKGVDLLAPIMRELGAGFELHYTGGTSATHDKPRMPANMHDIGRLQGDAEVVAAMQSADALLFPSRSEGFGLVAAEAMACGLPVITTRSSSLTEVVQDGETGLLCPQNDVPAFSSAARLLAADAEVHDRMAKAARQRAIRCFSIDAMLTKQMDAYLSCLPPPGSR